MGSTLSRAATNQTTLTEVTISVNQDIEIGAKEFILDRKAAYLSEGSIP